MNKYSGIMGGGLLVAGTCIGAGMIGLPVLTAATGFYPTMAAFILTLVFMNCSAFAYLESALRFKSNTNLISMVEYTLGPVAKAIAWIVYLLLLYSLMAAYTAGSTTLVAKVCNFNIENTLEMCTIMFLVILPLALIIYLGIKWTDYINRLLMLGLIVTFVILCICATKLKPTDAPQSIGESKYLLFTFPLLITSFGYHTIIPTLRSYLKSDVTKLRIAMLGGSSASFLMYAIWLLIIMHFLPVWGETGLVSMLHSGNNPADVLATALSSHNSNMRLYVLCFSFFALISSFIGVGLSMFDFLADGLEIKRTKRGLALLSGLTFGPPLLYTFMLPQGSLFALKYAGIFAAILMVIYPVLMAWQARYVRKIPGTYQMWGGKPLLILTFMFGLMIVFAELFMRMGLLPIPQ